MKIVRSLEDLRAIPVLDWVGYDLETTGLDPKNGKILLVSLTNDAGTWVVDLSPPTGMPLTQEVIAELKRILSTLVINHNIVFDYKWLYWHTGIEMPNMTDIMVNEQILTAGKFIPTMGKNGQFSLAAIALRRLNIQLDKDARLEFIDYTGDEPLSEQAFIYAGEDTKILKSIYDQQYAEIVEHGLIPTFQLECALLPVTATMELQGVKIDVESLRKLEAPIERYIATCYRILQDLIIAHGGADRIVFGKKYHAVNVSSKDQMLRAFNLLGIDVDSLSAKTLLKWDLRADKVSLRVLEDLLRDDEGDIGDAIEHFGGYDNPFLRAYAFYTGAEKILGTYVLGLQEKIQSDGKFYPWFRQCGARATGRYSSNAQQIPKNDKLDRLGLKGLSIRECIVAPEGRKLIIADFAAIELVILADMSGDMRLAHEILHGDIHIVVTREVLGKFFPIAQQITDANKGKSPFKNLRDFSKTFSYGIAYGVTGKNLADQASIKLAGIGLKFTVAQGNEGIQYWKEAFAQAGKFLDESAKMAVTRGYTTSAMGRKRWYDLEYIKSNKYAFFAAQREGSNQRIQSTSADMTKLAMLNCYRALDRSRASMILSIHDEIVLESDADYAEEAAQILKTSMERAGRAILKNLGDAVIVKPAISDRYDK